MAVGDDHPWKADRPLSVNGARAAIASQFPHVVEDQLEFLGSGWEFDVYRSSDGWVFRFPRRGEHARLFDREEQVLGLVRPALAGVVEVPRVELRGKPCAAFPYRFAGHRVVPGISADVAPSAGSEAAAAQIGRVLSRVHSIPESAGRASGLSVDADGCAEWLGEARAVGGELRGLAHAVDVGMDWVQSVTAVPASYRGPLRVIHNDLKAEHLLADSASGRLVGLIDWTDAALGDPALDFFGFLPWRGRVFLEAVLRSYEPAVDAGFRARIAFLSRVVSLVWLHEVVQQQSDCQQHIQWVARAFAGSESF